MTGGQLGARHPLKLGSFLSQKLGDRGVISPDVYSSKRWLPGPWEGHSWVIKQARGLFASKNLTCISKRQKNNL